MSGNQNENQLLPPYEQSITIGDSRHLAQALPDESIDLMFCDPPYLKATIEAGVYAWLAETARRVLRPDGFCLAYIGTYWKYQAMLQMGQFLEYFWEYSVLFREVLPVLFQQTGRPGA
jgi:predicted methyltransferase